MSAFAELQAEAYALAAKLGVALIEWSWDVAGHDPAAPNGALGWTCTAVGTTLRGTGHTGEGALSELVARMREV